MPKSKKCRECYNFITKEVNEKNYGGFKFEGHPTLNRKLQESGKVQVWWCKMGELKKELITVRAVALRVTNDNCPQRDED